MMQQLDSTVRDGDARRHSSVLDDMWRDREHRRHRRRRALRALGCMLLVLAVLAGIAYGLYSATGGDRRTTLAGTAIAGLLLAAAAIYRSHRRTMRELARPIPPRPTPAPASAIPPAPQPPPPTEAVVSPDGADDGRRRPPRPRSRHAVSIATALLLGSVGLALATSVAAVVIASGRGPNTAGAAQAAVTADPGPAGFAEQVIAAWLRAGEDHLAELQPLVAGPVDLAGVPSGSFDATRLSTISTTPLGPNYWSVLVAADRVQRVGSPDNRQVRWEPDGTHYYRVGVSGASGRYLASGLPGEVARPKPPTAPSLAIPSQAAADLSDPRTDTLERFFDAFLAGNGELTRYVLPGVPARPIDEPNRYTDSQVRTVGFDDPQARTRVTAAVTVVATNKAGNLQILAYSLTLINRDGRWYVKSLDAAAALAP
jgi:hypothetical protein